MEKKPDDLCTCGYKRSDHRWSTQTPACTAFDDPREPQYQHDCDACQFLGRYAQKVVYVNGDQELMSFDLYFCKGAAASSLGGTIIARHASKGSEYSSMPRDVFKSLMDRVGEGLHSTFYPALKEAFERSKEIK